MTRSTCPSCMQPGRTVSELTLRSLVDADRLAELGPPSGFTFCSTRDCSVAYFHEDSRTVDKSGVKVRIGAKVQEPPHPICYCFGYTAEDIADQLRSTGKTSIPDEITSNCRNGLDRCEETNPRGACCLGEIRAVARDAALPASQPVVPPASDASQSAKLASKGLFGFGTTMIAAIGTSVAAAACCIGPLIVAALGLGGAGAMLALAPYRPYLLVLTTLLLLLGFRWAYRKPPADACGCETPTAKRQRRWARVALWVTAVTVVAFAAVPHLVGSVGVGDSERNLVSAELPRSASRQTTVIPVRGMDCPACGVAIREVLDGVGGVEDFALDLDAQTVTITFAGEAETVAGYIQAIGRLGFEVGQPIDDISIP